MDCKGVPVFAEIASYVAQVLDTVHLYRAGTDGTVVLVVERQEKVFAGDVVICDVGHSPVVDVSIATRLRHVERVGGVGYIKFHHPVGMGICFPFDNIVTDVVTQTYGTNFRCSAGAAPCQ